MKYRSDEIDPSKFAELFNVLVHRTDVVTPTVALEAYLRQWRFVNYEIMHNDERMLLQELIDELSGGIFEPYFDEHGNNRRPVIVELKLLTYEELMKDKTEFIGPPQPPKMQMKLTEEEKQKIKGFAEQLVADHMSKRSSDTSSD